MITNFLALTLLSAGRQLLTTGSKKFLDYQVMKLENTQNFEKLQV